MRLFHNRKRSSFTRAAAETRFRCVVGLMPIVLLAFCLDKVTATSLSCTVASSFYFGALFIVIPQIASKSIRQGIEVENESTTISLISSTTLPPPASVFSSRALQLDNVTSSEEFEHLDSSAEDNSKMANLKEFENSKTPKRGRVSRQMGLAAEIAMVAPALQTMGCIPKFFCGMNSKSPTDGTTTLNDLAYLIKFAMLDDDDVENDETLFGSNDRGKDGLQGTKGRNPLNKIKDDLIIENMAEEELIQEDPANLPFVWQDMEHRIKTKTKPGTKERLDDEIMDAIIVEPEQSHMTSLFTGIKSVLRIGRSVDHILSNSSQGTARSGEGDYYQTSQEDNLRAQKQLFGRRRWPLPFMKSPKFRQEMELAHRIGKEDRDDTRCSSTFNTCPYTTHEMMEIVYGGYKKRNKKKPQWFVNAEGPPESSEEVTGKPFKDPLNLITTTTKKPKLWIPSEPEHQLLYAILPNKAIEKGFTTIPTTRRPRPQPVQASFEDDEDDKPKRERRPPIRIQQHVEYENDDEYSKEGNASQLDMKINKNKKRRPWEKPPNGGQFNRPPTNGPPGPTAFTSPAPASSEERNNRKKNEASESQEEDGSSEESSKDQPPAMMPPQFQHGPMGHNQPQQQQSGFKLPSLFSSLTSQQRPQPIAQPRPKYTVQKPKNGMRLPALPPMHGQQQQPMPFEDGKKEKTSEEEEGEEESGENSSEELKTKKGASRPPGAGGHTQPGSNQNGIILMGRPSEEIKPGDMAFFQQQSNPSSPPTSFEDENSDEQNSNSGPVGSREHMVFMEMEKIPKPAQRPRNNSNEYTYSDEMPPPQNRPINYSYFKPRPQENGPPSPGPSGSPEPPQTSTQKLSTGFLGFIFGNKDKQKGQQNGFGGPDDRRRPPGVSGEEDDDANADDDDSDEDEEPQSDVAPKQIPGVEGNFEVGHLGQQSPVKPNFQPPVRPQRPFKGSTSMEDSDEKKFRSSNAPPTLPPQSSLITDPGRPILFIGKPHRIQIPAPATPPSEAAEPPSPAPVASTKPPKDSEEDDEDRDSDEKQSDESKEDSSEEKGKKTSKKSKNRTKNSKQEMTQSPPPNDKHAPPTQTRSEPPKNKNKKRREDSKEDDDSGEEKSKEKDSTESDEGSSEEEKKPARRPSPPPNRKPEDDELESPNNDNLPPLPPFGGDIAVIGDILGAPVKEHEDDEDGYGPDEDIPAPPPLIQGFAQSLEIVVPTKPPPLVSSNNVGLQQGPPANQGAGLNNPGAASGTRDPSSNQAQGLRNPGGSNRGPNSNGNRGQQQNPKEDGDKKDKSSEENSSEEKKTKSSEEASSEETDVIKGVAQGFDAVKLGGDEQEENENEESPGKQPPHPPPVFTGTTAQKQQININKPFLPRPVSAPQTQYRPTNLRLGMNQKPPGGGTHMQQRPSFVSNLLRPLMGRPAYKKKPLDPKVVQWIKDSYGIPDLEQPNRSGLESQAVKGTHFLNSTTTTRKPKTPKPTKSNKNKSVEKPSKSNKRKSPDYVTEEHEAEMAQALFDSSEEIGIPPKTTSTPPPKKSSSSERKKASGEQPKTSSEGSQSKKSSSSELGKKRKSSSVENSTKRKTASKETKNATSEKVKPLIPPKIVPAKLPSKVSRVKNRTPSVPKLPPIYGKKRPKHRT